MEKKLIKSIFLRFKTNNIRLKIQCPRGRAGSTPAAGILPSEMIGKHESKRTLKITSRFFLYSKNMIQIKEP